MSNFQRLTDDHVLHYARKGFLRIRVECLCGWEVEGLYTAQGLIESETARHIRMVKGPEPETAPTAEDVR